MNRSTAVLRVGLSRHVGVAIAAVLAILVSGCSSDGEGRTSAPDVLNVTLDPAITETLNPISQTNPAQTQVFSILFESLLVRDENNELAPGAAESWEVAEDGRRVTFNLKQDIRWTDDTPFTSADVVWSLGQYLGNAASVHAANLSGVVGQSEYANGDADSISGLSAPDDYTVEVALTEPDAAFLHTLSDPTIPMLPSHVLGELAGDALLEADFWQQPDVSFGPYKFERWKQDELIELSANETWHGGDVAFSGVVMKLLTEDVATVQLETGELHASHLVSPDTAEALEGSADIELSTAPSTYPDRLTVNTRSPRLTDPQVRQALALAIDGESICREVLGGSCTPAVNNVQLLAPDWVIPEPGSVESLEYDPERSRDLLAEAGWNPDQTLVFLQLPGDAYWSSVIALVQSQLSEVGVKVEIRSVTIPQFLELAEKPNDWDLYNMDAGAFYDPDALRQYSACEQIYPAGPNVAGFCDEQLDVLWERGRRAVTPEERAPTYREIFDIMNQSPSQVALYFGDLAVAHSSQLEGVSRVPRPYTNIGEWTWS